MFAAAPVERSAGAAEQCAELSSLRTTAWCARDGTAARGHGLAYLLMDRVDETEDLVRALRGRRDLPDPGPIADDDPLVRSGLSLLFAATDDIRVVAESADGTEVGPAVAAYDPDLVLMDIRMPKLDGLAATELLRTGDRAPEVIVLTTFDADEHVLRALRAGASGFLFKDTPPEEIVAAVRKVAAGEVMLSPQVTRRLVEHVAESGGEARRARARNALERLTDREREVARALGEGKSKPRSRRSST
jgi:DNA-binding NarL/FixJ family response regulator